MPGGLLLLLWVALMRLLLGVVRVVMLLGMKHMLPPSSLDSTNKYIGPWVLSYQMSWWERLH